MSFFDLLLPGIFWGCLIYGGIAITQQFLQFRGWSQPDAALTSPVIIGFAGYSTFWAYVISPGLGIIVKLAFLGAALSSAVFLWSKKHRIHINDLFAGLAAVISALLLILASFAGSESSDIISVASTRWSHPLPGDNRLPLIFADALRSGSVPTPLAGDWLSSDRPPLQTGLFLLFELFSGGPITYQIICMNLQMLAIYYVWLTARELGASLSGTLITTVTFGFTPLVVIHGTFVWPKLLASAFLFAPFIIYFVRPFNKIRDNTNLAIVAGVGGALSALAHGSSLFALLAMAVTALSFHRIASLKFVVAGIASAFTLLASWSFYQTIIDPPGNRLTKWHLAGVVPIDDRSLRETLRDEYRNISVTDAAERRIKNFSTAFPVSIQDFRRSLTFPLSDPTARVEIGKDLRAKAFFKPPNALGTIGTIWPLILLLPLFSRFRLLIVPIVGSYFVWGALMYDEGSMIVHQGPFWMFTATLVLIMAVIAKRSLIIASIIAALQVISTVCIFLF